MEHKMTAIKHELYKAKMNLEVFMNTTYRLKKEKEELQYEIQTLNKEIVKLEKAHDGDWLEILELRRQIKNKEK